MICLYKLPLPHMSCDPVPLSGTHPDFHLSWFSGFPYPGFISKTTELPIGPFPALQSGRSPGMPLGLSLFDALSGSLPWAARPLWATNCPALHFRGSRREKWANQSPSSSPARSRSVIILETKVFPKLGCVLSSEKLIKNKDSWASTQNSWCGRGCLGTRICTQSLKRYWLQPATGWPVVRDLLAYRQRVFVSELWLSE